MGPARQGSEMCFCTYKNFVFVRSKKLSARGARRPPVASPGARLCNFADRSMARPRKLNARRTRRLIVRLTDEDCARICANAQKSGLSVSEYVRRVAIGGHIVVREQSGYGMALAIQLRKVGINVNQLARYANTHEELPPELARVLPKLETILDRIIRVE